MISQFYGQSSYYLLEQDFSVREAKLILGGKKKSTSNSDLYSDTLSQIDMSNIM